MSLFNFNPSAFLGSGAFALDPSKFDFSNINVPSTTPDPLDIVAPEPEVKYSPVVEQAAQGGMLTGNVDLGMNFGLGNTQLSTDNMLTPVVGDPSLQAGFDAGNTRDTLVTKTERDTKDLIKNLALETESPFDVDALNKAKETMDGASFAQYLNQIVATPSIVTGKLKCL